jgi:hypothetical protein
MRRKTTEQFILESKEIHPDKYDYDKTSYIRRDSDVTITCPTHGDFEQRPGNHLNGQGCPKCGLLKCTLSGTKSSSSFIEEAKSVHTNLYSYDEVEYTGAHEKVTITCPIHGNFEQTPANHLSGSGCKMCTKKGWGDRDWDAKGKNSRNFSSYKTYIIKCWNDTEEFYKIGKTFKEVNRRFAGSQLPYNYEVIKIYESLTNGVEISKIERELQTKNKDYKYVPKLKFGGMYECFNKLG